MIYVAYGDAEEEAVRASWPESCPALGDGAPCMIAGFTGRVHGAVLSADQVTDLWMAIGGRSVLIGRTIPDGVEVQFDVAHDSPD